jgi:hypothetical protein
LIFGAFLITSVMLYLGGRELFAAILLGCAGLTLIWIFVSGRGNHRHFHP